MCLELESNQEFETKYYQQQNELHDVLGAPFWQPDNNNPVAMLHDNRLLKQAQFQGFFPNQRLRNHAKTIPENEVSMYFFCEIATFIKYLLT